MLHFDVIVVDVFNYAFKFVDSTKLSVEATANRVIDAIAKDLFSLGDECWLVFDPIIDELSPRTKTLTTRQQQLASYKQNRKMPKELPAVMHLVEKFFETKACDILHIVEDKKYEADDFELSIVNSYDSNKMIALVTTDMDWARCLSKNVAMFHNGDLFTAIDFEKKYEFRPTYASLTLFKAVFGDPSDNISPVVNRQTEFKKAAFRTVQYVAENNLSLEDLDKLLERKNIEQPDTNLNDPVNRFAFMLWNSNNSDWAQSLFTNIDVIKSKNVDAYKHQKKISAASLEAMMILKRLDRQTKKQQTFKLKAINI